MHIWLYRTVSVILTLVFVLSCAVTGTLSWQSLNQQTKNEVMGVSRAFDVRLLKLEKLKDGTLTDKPIAGAAFYLFTADNKQIGGRYVSDSNGRIELKLKKGDYYFEEIDPGTSHTFDQKDGKPLTRYPFSVIGEQNKTVIVRAYNIPLDGSLIIQKIVRNSDDTPLTEEQKQKAFEFTVTFSDGGTYFYRVNDGELKELKSGGTLYLKHGQSAVFENIPVGVLYTVEETPEPFYSISGSETRGNIVTEGCTATFVNTFGNTSTGTAQIRVTKKLAGEYPKQDENKEFHLALITDGKKTEFTLKPDETVVFEIPANSYYEVIEDDGYKDGYSQSIVNGSGTLTSDQVVEVVVTNTYIGTVYIDIDGDKTWDLYGYDESVMPDSITVRLMQDGHLTEEKTITPNESGQWHYTFTVPKYDANGKEIKYIVEEVPLEGFSPSYDGFNIKNTYLPPVVVDTPTVHKIVQGDEPPETKFEFILKGEADAPMPSDSKGNSKIISVNGSGKADFGKITFTKSGVYVYTITELYGGKEGWSYDTASYKLLVTVTEENGKLNVSHTLTKDGKNVSVVEFTNRYDKIITSDKIIISGQKIWNHGANPKENHPQSIIVEIYGDGDLVMQYQVTEKDDWSYSFELPECADNGHKIVYTISETNVPDYKMTVEGYNLINTYSPDKPDEPDTPDIPDKPDEPDTPDIPDNPDEP
ncbi:MAG: Cna B-type domain-containing protein, partial [Acutalibacteraceae bacterium]